MTTIDTPASYPARIRQALGNCLVETNVFPEGKHAGKVRDRYERGDRLVLVTTDRQSAFDRVLAAIPFKGQVLNQLSAWWFEQTADLVDIVLAFGVPRLIPDPAQEYHGQGGEHADDRDHDQKFDQGEGALGALTE